MMIKYGSKIIIVRKELYVNYLYLPIKLSKKTNLIFLTSDLFNVGNDQGLYLGLLDKGELLYRSIINVEAQSSTKLCEIKDIIYAVYIQSNLQKRKIL